MNEFKEKEQWRRKPGASCLPWEQFRGLLLCMLMHAEMQPLQWSASAERLVRCGDLF